MARPNDGPLRVVHVDAEESLNQYLPNHLHDVWEVIAVDSGEECLQVVREGDVDCVVSEYDLRDTNGVALLEAVQVVAPDVPFVLLTASGSETVASDAVGAGVADYLSKRASPETIAERLNTSLASSNSADEATEVADRYRRLVETSPAPIAIIDDDSRLVYGNDALVDLIGVASFAELHGRPIREFIHPDDHALIEERMQQVFEEDRSVPMTELTVVRPDGETRYVQVATAPGARHGECVGQAVIVDVTRLHETQQELRSERQFVESALDALDDLFYVINPEGDILRWNERGAKVTGYTEAELAEMELDDLFIGNDAERVYQSLALAIEEGSDVVEATLVTKQGRTVPYEFRGRRLTDESGEVVGVVGIGRDVSDRVEWERELSRQQERLTHLNRANEIVRDVNQVLVMAESRQEIEQAICDQFAGDGPYRFGWIGRLDRGHQNVVPQTWAGVEKGYLDTIEIPLDEGPASQGPVAQAIRSGEVQTIRVTDPVFEPWRERAQDRGYEAVIVVPISYEGTTYGVLAVYAGTPAETEYLEETVLAELGQTVGYAINAVERKRALIVDSVLELDLEISDSTEFFCRFSTAVDAPVVLEKVTPQSDGSYTVFLTVETADPTRVEAVCDRFQSVESSTILTQRSEECVVELRVCESLVVDLMATHGSAVRALTAVDGTCKLTAELPPTGDVRSLVESLRSAYSEVELEAQRERTDDKRPWLGHPIEELLTERQQQVLEIAYFSGYFSEKRKSSGAELAEVLGISGPTFHHHLRAAQRRLLETLLDPSGGQGGDTA